MRLFAGIELDESTRAMCSIIRSRLERAAFDARYEDPHKLHVTLAFLGSVRDDQRTAVEEALETTAASMSSFALTLDRLNAFPNARRPRILYVGSREQGQAFRSLAHALRDRYRALGFDFQDDAVAHVTLGRVKGGSRRPLPMLDLAAHAMPVTEIALFESLPAGATTRYEIRRRARLRSVD